MSVLDGLREDLDTYLAAEMLETNSAKTKDHIEIIRCGVAIVLRDFEKAHPGLVDETSTCDCGKVWPDGSLITRNCRLKRFVCPACAKEATDA